MSSATIRCVVFFIAMNQAGAISGKLAAVQYFHRVEASLELPTGAPLVQRALKGVEKTHVAVGTKARVGMPVSWETILSEQALISAWGSRGWVFLLLSVGTFRGNFCVFRIGHSPGALSATRRRHVL